MPALLAAPWFIPLMTGIGAATTVGTSAYELSKGSGSSSTSQQAATTLADQQKAAQAAQQRSAVLANQGNTQSQTGGSLTPTGFLTQSAKGTGMQGADLQSMLQSMVGGGSGGGGSISGGTTTPNSDQGGAGAGALANLSDLLKAG